MPFRTVYLIVAAFILVVVGCSRGGQPIQEAAPAPASIAPTATPSESTAQVTRATLKDVLRLLPDHVTDLTLDDLSALLSDSELRRLAEERHLDYWGDRLEELGIFTEDITTLTGVIAGQSGELVVLSGNLDSEEIKDELYDLGFEEDDYRGTEVWSGEWPGDGGPDVSSVAVGFLSNGMVVIGWPSEGGTDEVKDVIRVLERGSGSLYEYGSMQRLAEALPEGVSSKVELGCSPWGIRGCVAWGESVEVVDADTVQTNWVLVFEDERGAGFGVDDVEEMLERRGDANELTVSQVGDVVVARGFVDTDDAVASLSSGSVLATPSPAASAPAEPAQAATAPATTAPAAPAPAASALHARPVPSSNAPPAREEPAGPTPTPGPVVSQPTVNVNKEWQTIILKNKSLESNGIEYTIKQLRFGTPEELLPDLEFEELQELNLDAAQAIVGIIVKVVNKRNSTITVTPGGNNATLLVNQELSKPIPQLSEVRGQLPAGSHTNFTVLFPLVINSLEDITELYFLINEHRFHYTELVASQVSATPSSSTPTGGIFRRLSADPPTLDPHLTSDTTSAGIVVEIFSGLITLDTDLSLQPDIAERWETSGGGTVYTFFLRKEAKFHDGKPITAQDFVWSLNRAANPKIASPVASTYLNDIVGVSEVLSGEATQISGVKAIDEHTLQITIDGPKAYFPAKLTYPTAFVLDRENVESGDNWTDHPNGSGPFRLKEYRVGERIILERNDLFYLEPAKLDQVFMNLAGGQAMAMYENDEIDITGVGLFDLERLRDPNEPLSSDLKVAPPGFSVTYIGFNPNEPPFDDLKFRQALNHAIDKELIAEEVLTGLRVPAYGVLPPGFPGYDPTINGLRFDREKAKSLLEESDYADPDTRPRIVITVPGTGGTIGLDMEVILEMWRQNLGVEVEIQQVEWATFLQDLNRKRFQAFAGLTWQADYPDPQDFLDILFHTDSETNHGGYSNPEVDRFLEMARVEQDARRRISLYNQVEEMIVEDAPWVPLWWASERHLLLKPWVKGYALTPITVPKLRYVWIQGS